MQRSLAAQLTIDPEFHDYICEGPTCSEDEFFDGLTFTDVVLRDVPRTLGCIVGPANPALTRIYGVFVLDQPTPNLALIYLGIDIWVDPAAKKPGFKDLLGSERLGPGTWVTHRFVWSVAGYALESTTTEVPTPEQLPAPEPP